MALVKIYCAWCNEPTMKRQAHINRARDAGCYLYCGRVCSGLGRRTGKTKAQKVAEKAAYDAEYRAKNLALLKAKKAAYYQRTRDPVKEAAVRKKRMPLHVAYCRRPEYKAKKHVYDANRYAEQFGPFAECHKLLMQIDAEVDSRMSDYEVRQANGTLNKRLQRRRDHARTFCRELEAAAVGNPAGDQGRQDAGQSG